MRNQQLIEDAIFRCYRICEGLYGSDYKPDYCKPRTSEDVVAALGFLLADLKDNPRIICQDIESMFVTEFGAKAKDPWHPDYKVWMIGLSVDDYEAVCIPFDPDSFLIEKFGLTSIYEEPKILEIMMEFAGMNCLHHSTADALSLARYGIRFDDLDDSMLVQYAIDDTAGDQGIDDLARFYTEEQGFKSLDYPYAVPLVEFEWDKLANRCCHDVDIERRIFNTLKKEAQSEDVWDAYVNVLKPSNMLGIEMTLNGIAIDKQFLINLIKSEREEQKPFIEEFYKREEVKRLYDYIQKILQTEPKHKDIKKLQTIQKIEDITVFKNWLMELLLYDVCKLPCLNKTAKGARMVDAKDLERVKKEKPKHSRLVDIILEIKRIEKKLSTYLLPYVEPKLTAGGDVERYQYLKDDGFVHPNFHFGRARSGRSSSSEPNFQNIVNDINIKKCFVSRWR